MVSFVAHLREDGAQQSVLEHLQGVADLAAAFARPFGGEADARQAGMLHDIGKYSDGFQQHIRNPALPIRVDHSTAGAQAIGAATVPAFVIAGHHAGLADGGSPSDGAEAPTLAGRLKKKLSPREDCAPWRREQPVIPAAGSPAFCQTGDRFTRSFYTRMLYSALVDADFLDTERFMQGALPRESGCTLDTLSQRLHQFFADQARPDSPINRHRNGILDACIRQGGCPKGLFTLTVPTGGGKTLSSLAFALAHAKAHGMRRVIYVIPYTSIIDQTGAVFSDILGAEAVLEHHSGMDYDAEESAGEAERRKALATENWDAPLIVTTAVQFFESLYANRSSRCRKLHNLADAVILFDEAQTLPTPYLLPCVAAIGELVLHYGVSAVLCTATQPALNPYFSPLGLESRELCPDPAAEYRFFRRNTLEQLGELHEAALFSRLSAHPQVLCIVNRKAQAQRCYQALPDSGETYCLTTLLCPHDRKRLLAEIRTRLHEGLPCRVVATSLVEAGVDLDFPTVYREEAGLDSILQAAGRCNREMTHTPEESRVYIFRLPGRSFSLLAQNISATRSVMRRCGDLTSLEAIQQYFCHFRALRGSAALDEQGILPAFRSGIQGCAMPFVQVAQRFQLIRSPTRTVYIPTEENADLLRTLREGFRSRRLYRQLGQFSVSVYPQEFQTLYDMGALEVLDTGEAILLSAHIYHRALGLLIPSEGGQALGLDLL